MQLVYVYLTISIFILMSSNYCTGMESSIVSKAVKLVVLDLRILNLTTTLF